MTGHFAPANSRQITKMKNKLSVFAVLLALVGCKPESSAPSTPSMPASPVPKTYSVRGVVQAVAPDHWLATIKHEVIPGYMAAMTMDFPVRDTNENSAAFPPETKFHFHACGHGNERLD